MEKLDWVKTGEIRMENLGLIVFVAVGVLLADVVKIALRYIRKELL